MSDTGPAAEFRHRRQVQFADTDMAGIVHFTAYFRYMEEAEHALWRAAGCSIAAPGAAIGWPRVAAAFDYKAPLRFEDEFQIAVRFGTVSRRTIQYRFTLTRSEVMIGTGMLTVACATHLPDGRLQSAELPPGLIERLRGAMDVPRSPSVYP